MLLGREASKSRTSGSPKPVILCGGDRSASCRMAAIRRSWAVAATKPKWVPRCKERYAMLEARENRCDCQKGKRGNEEEKGMTRRKRAASPLRATLLA